jgi:methyl coenzyme M reductase beta subunit
VKSLQLLEAISELSIGELVRYIALIVAGAAAFVEKTSKTMKPLTKLAKAIGRAINGELMEKVDSLEQKVEKMAQEEQLQRAKDARTRVLRFGDELIHDVRHTKEHFDDVLRDITEYEKYCDEHPKFENDQMHITAEHIKETYHKCLKEHSFL